MQVWSPRKRPADEIASPASGRGGGSVADVWALRVLAGVHGGAERKLQDHCFLMVGSSDDCDLIFSDAGVAAHHCIITRTGSELSVRAVDADVRIDDHMLHPGDPQEIKPFSLIRIGGACLALGPHWSDRWQSLLSQIESTAVTKAVAAEQAAPRQRSSKAMTLGVAVTLMLASAGALVLAQHNAKPPPVPEAAPARDGELRALIDSLGYKGLKVIERSDGKLVINGYTERNEDIANLRAQLDQRGIKAEIEAKSGPRIADDVSEQFRMKNLHAKTEWKGNGHVLARGRFGDETEVRAFLASRTVQDFNQKLNLKVDLENLDPPPADAKSVPDGKRINKIVTGPDPYLKSVDNSVFYVDSKLPNGDTFVGIENDEVLVRDAAGNTRHLPRDSVVDAPVTLREE